MSFQSLGRQCPICDGARSDCRESLSTGLIHCRDTSANPGGQWRYIRDDANGFGMWAWGEGEDKRHDRPAYTPKAKAPQAPAVAAWGVAERDKGYRPLVGKLTLEHRLALRKRGIPDTEINALVDAGIVATWPGGQTVAGAHLGLPGVRPDGRLVAWNTWAVLAHDVDGNIIGVQYRNDKTPEQGKYKWASGWDGAKVNLGSEDGELPITVLGDAPEVRPDKKWDGLTRTYSMGEVRILELCEGIGFKPALGWLRYGGVWVGAAGGNFASSPTQLKSIIDRHNITEAVLNADAGAVQNANVMAAYRRLATLLESWGVTLRVRWWGQTTKAHGDVDEISPETFHGATLLPWMAFEAMAAPAENAAAKVKRQRAKDTKELKRKQTEARSLAILTQSLPQAHRETSGGYLPPLPTLPEGYGGYALDAGMGAGKTTTIGRDIVAPAIKDKVFVAEIFGRNSLSAQTTWKHGLVHMRIADTCSQDFGAMVEEHGGMGGCYNSLPRINQHITNAPAVIVDEAMATFTEALEGGTLKGRYSEVVTTFLETMRSASTLTISESNLDAPTLEFAERVSGKRLMVIRHHADQARYPIHLATGSSPNGMFGQMVQHLKAGQIIMLCSTSVDEAHGWDLYAKENGINSTLITGETNESGIFDAFFSNPDQYLEANQTQFLIVTQSVQAGLSIERYPFDVVYGYGPGFSPEVLYQMVGRVRLPIPRYLWVPSFIQPSRYERPQRASILEEIGHEVGQWAAKGFAPKPDSDQALIDEYLAARWEIRWAQKVLPGKALTLMFERAGQTVTPAEWEPDQGILEMRAAYREKLARIRSDFHASLKIHPEMHTAEWAKAKREDGSATYRDRCILRKISTLERFPGINWDDAEIWYQAVFQPRSNDHGPLAPGAALWAECDAADTLQAIADDEAGTILAQRLRSISLLPDYGAKLAILAPMRPVCEQILAKGSTSPGCPLVRRLAAMARAVGDDLTRYLRIVAGEEHSDQAIAHKILRKFGIILERKTYRKVGRARQWTYSVTAPPLWQSLVDARRIALNALGARVPGAVTNLLDDPINKSVTPPLAVDPPPPDKPTHRWPLMGLEGWIERIEAGVNAIFHTEGMTFNVYRGELEALEVAA